VGSLLRLVHEDVPGGEPLAVLIPAALDLEGSRGSTEVKVGRELEGHVGIVSRSGSLKH